MAQDQKQNQKAPKQGTQKTSSTDKKEDFQYIVRMASRDLDGERKVRLALADLKGVGDRLAQIIVKKLDNPADKKIGELKEEYLYRMREFIESRDYEGLPSWTLNHRKETVSGSDVNIVSNDLDLAIQDDVNLMKKIKSYRGVRHEKGKKVRGQRTRSNGRKGLTVGVQRKKD